MSNEFDTPTETSVVKLMRGIVTDVQTLVKQQLALFRHEIKVDLDNAREGVVLLGMGLAILIIGGGLIGAMLVHLLAALAPQMPLWGSYGIVGVSIGVLGGICIAAGLKKFKHIELPEVEALHELKEKLDG